MRPEGNREPARNMERRQEYRPRRAGKQSLARARALAGAKRRWSGLSSVAVPTFSTVVQAPSRSLAKPRVGRTLSSSGSSDAK